MEKIMYSVVVPCKDEEGSIASTVTELRRVMQALGHYRIVVIDDGSRDGTAAILAELQKQHSELVVVTHQENRGYGAALKSGVRAVESDVVIITDADGTYPNDRIPDLVAEINRGCDMVVGERSGPNVTYSPIRRIPKVFLRAYVSYIVGRPIVDINSGLRAFRREALLPFLPLLPNSFSFTTTITIAMYTNDRRVAFIPINYARRVGKSKIKPIRDTLRFFQLIMRTGMYFAPLRVFLPIAALLMTGFTVSLAYDLIEENLTDKTILLLLFALNTGMFALLADMIDKRQRTY